MFLDEWSAVRYPPIGWFVGYARKWATGLLPISRLVFPNKPELHRPDPTPHDRI